ncbi:ImmA/IrrE family metallo-endopeptidase [Ruminococcus sp. CLA-AA-H200]|uniref:ImmA/IrrE family metallo-endopeptidase n=1 Tax=Ruminococcus turbiniformis TaxID=2881258 RepID=A0ABS8G268_9FIRM|nr:ImmA/IrrE family metallo-endopeptidase [Ruminococcus turbiniformis]MCC2255954.1 ImmA/IrrE family metallo-endopeptidase [Ruminococcus turbiniformis]
MTIDTIHNTTEKLARRFQTRDPIEILEGLHVILGESSRYKRLKGYCFLSCQTIYVMFNSALSEYEKRIVAAHELGHITLHRSQLRIAPMSDSQLYNMVDKTEYQANLFAADLLISDQAVEGLSQNPDLDYFDFCSTLYVPPELMSFKLYSLIQRGHQYNMPLGIDSSFLAN